MLRPFFVHIPRNCFGEYLEFAPITFANALDKPLKELGSFPIGTTLKEAEIFIEKLNDNFAAEQMVNI